MKTFVALFILAVASMTALAGDNEAEILAMFQKMKTASYPASTFTKPMAWSVGQWVLFGNTDDDGEKSVSRMAIIARDGEWWTVEMKNMSEDDVTILQLELKGLNFVTSADNMDQVDFRKIRMKHNDDDPIEIEGFMLNMAKGMYKDGLKGWVMENTTIKPGPAITVPAGTFAGSSVAQSKVHMLGEEVESETWLSASVPITGLIKSTSSDGYSMVLLDFGLDGATASF
ncbi:MAG: hypothetical protein J5I53_05300 [Bradyrhizobiaceae bacterium]|nr:hypothetical protein [Bradyrhizobiaceae bacterium]